MWQGPWFVVLLFSYGSVAQTLTQPKASITVSVGKTALIRCQVKGGSISSTSPLHWYQQKPGKPPQRILYYGESISRDPGIGESFDAIKTANHEVYLTIAVNTESAATYYCAYWVYTVCNRKQTLHKKLDEQPVKRNRRSGDCSDTQLELRLPVYVGQELMCAQEAGTEAADSARPQFHYKEGKSSALETRIHDCTSGVRVKRRERRMGVGSVVGVQHSLSQNRSQVRK
ncbi:uncharacterized protein LOC134344493 [Mobula hypostoma]|uniref:uncharacterized protein LOC134344493 n=1 Tax=Mobula hypostoma TaxID=723540 RepID=UPI002FC368AB